VHGSSQFSNELAAHSDNTLAPAAFIAWLKEAAEQWAGRTSIPQARQGQQTGLGRDGPGDAQTNAGNPSKPWFFLLTPPKSLIYLIMKEKRWDCES
jgi:hypothetical protein